MLEAALDKRTYDVCIAQDIEQLLQWVGKNRHRVDCLILEYRPEIPEIFQSLKQRDILLPTLLILTEQSSPETSTAPFTDSGKATNCQALADEYHNEAICVRQPELSNLEEWVQRAINQFLNLPPSVTTNTPELPSSEDTRLFVLSLQQQRLAEKLRERLGYVGVYYKRDPANFVRNLDPAERERLYSQLRRDYRALVLIYFSENPGPNRKIDDFVNQAFFADISVSKIVEIHMELMEVFAKQLKLEGRSEEILLDYRLTLIDVIAHLCEMYRRSVPRDSAE